MRGKALIFIRLFASAFIIIGGLAAYRQALGNIGYYLAFNKINPVYLVCVARDAGFILAGAGILYLKKWSRYLAIILSAANILESAYDLTAYLSAGQRMRMEESYGAFIYAGLALNSIILCFFSSPKVKAYFK